jgi:hypothetical protein
LCSPYGTQLKPLGARSASPVVEERINYKPGHEIFVRFTTEPDAEMYEFLRDYMEFRVDRLKKQPKQKAPKPEE